MRVPSEDRLGTIRVDTCRTRPVSPGSLRAMPVDLGLLVTFVLTTVVAMLVPGPDMLLVLGCGLRGGPRVGLLATCGVATSETIHVLVAAAV